MSVRPGEDQFSLRGMPGHFQPDDGPEFSATVVPDWIAAIGSLFADIEPGSPEERRLRKPRRQARGELLDGAVIGSRVETSLVIEQARRYRRQPRRPAAGRAGRRPRRVLRLRPHGRTTPPSQGRQAGPMAVQREPGGEAIGTGPDTM
ncbi:hypothetical protein ASF52_21750 [Methylobacterium sp. Leaf112]|nr:hypothetical protein ASF52_21750 [Methylobacterium sp. Leaf112]